MELSTQIKGTIVEAILKHRENYTGPDSTFAKSLGIAPAVFSQIKGGARENIIKTNKWLELAEKYNISLTKKQWKLVRTKVYQAIEEDVLNCQKHAIGLLFADECEIGKTTALKHISITHKNCFYIDCSQTRKASSFKRAVAKALGVEHTGKLDEVSRNIKQQLCLLSSEHPVVMMLDEYGDLDHNCYLEVKSWMNYCNDYGHVGWYGVGADGLKHKIERGIANHKVGFRELFSRHGSRYTSVVPKGREDKALFYQELIGQVLTANVTKKTEIKRLTSAAMISDLDGHFGGLRRAKFKVLLEQ